LYPVCVIFQCQAGPSVYNMFNALYSNEAYNMVLGPACSVSAQATAEVSHLWNITQVGTTTLMMISLSL